jgi:hypothetical protein
VSEGSANLTACRNLEQFFLANDPQLYAAHAAWINATIETPTK